MRRAVAAGCVALLACTVASWRITAPAAPPFLAPFAPLSVVAVQRDADPADPTPVARSYNVTKALEQIRALGDSDDAEQTLKHYLVAAQLPFREIDESLEINDDPDFGTNWRLTATPKQHAAFADLLEGLELAGERQVATQVWRLELPSIEAAGVLDWDAAIGFRKSDPRDAGPIPDFSGGGTSATSTTESYSPYLSVVLSETQTDAFWKRIKSGADNVNALSTPKVTTFSGQRAAVSDQSQRPFVIGVAPVVGEFAKAYQPQVGVFDEGFRCDLRALALESGRIRVNCEVSVSHVDDIETFTIPGEGVTVQLPDVTRDTLHAREELAAGESLLLAPRVAPRDGESTITCVLVQPQLIE